MATLEETKFFDKLIDDFGIWQHSDGAEIKTDEGYTLRDAATGLLVTLSLGKDTKSETLFSYIEKSQIGETVFGFAGKDRNFLPEIASSVAIGQTIWAAGYAFSKSFYRNESVRLINKSTQMLDKANDIYGFAFGLLGAVYVNKELSDYFFERIKLHYNDVTEDWVWYESIVTSNSGIISYALLRYGLVYKNNEAVILGRKILQFLEKCCTYERQRGPIGSETNMTKGDKVASNYPQSPTDAAYMVWAWLVAYQISNDSFDKERCDGWMQWFEGNNILRVKMYDPVDSHCFDSIEQWGVKYTSSAEANISMLLSKYMTSENITI
ncbi:MAG: hypothetical protein PHO93_00300 [Candidatus Saccharimonadaceae bacterium]|nr:hypothetical protein [Candidatus Saccharimonadaceae bacterium]